MSDVDLLGYLDSLIDLDAETAYSALNFRMAEEQLNSAKVAGSTVDQQRRHVDQRSASGPGGSPSAQLAFVLIHANFYRGRPDRIALLFRNRTLDLPRCRRHVWLEAQPSDFHSRQP